MRRLLVLLTLATTLAACSTPPERGEPPGITPALLSESPELLPRGTRLQWGGLIMSVENLADNTLLEIIAYPLSSAGEPLTGRDSLGRFLADRPGFLEPRDYRPGRRVTVSGPLLGHQDREVGEAVRALPALQAEQLRLWEPYASVPYYRRPRVGVGIGGGSYGSGVGIGVGF